MAWNVFNWAKRQPVSTPTQKLVLLLLANYAHKDGSNARPAVGRLMEESRLSRRAVQKALTDLRDEGYIQLLTSRKGGQGNPAHWRVCIEKGERDAPLKGAGDAPLEEKKGASNDVKGASNDVKGAPGAPEALEPLEPLAVAALPDAPKGVESSDEERPPIPQSIKSIVQEMKWKDTPVHLRERGLVKK